MENTPIHVYKFGGASVESASAVKNAAEIIKNYPLGNPLLVIVSAMGKMTNALEELHNLQFHKKPYSTCFDKIKEYHYCILELLINDKAQPVYEDIYNTFIEMEWLLEENPPKNYDFSYDQIVCYGELLSTKIVAAFLNQSSVKCKWIDARTFIQTDNTYRDSKIQWELTEKLISEDLAPLLKDQVLLTQGFIGGTSENYTTTLGREGSDFSAAIFSKCLKASSMTIWKDVEGIMNADPAIFGHTITYNQLSYHTMIEMSYYGAKVIHPKTIKPLENAKIPLYVRCFKDPSKKGTVINDVKSPDFKPAIILKINQCLISISVKDYSFITEQNLSKIFDLASMFRLKINLMQNSAISFSICVDEETGKLEPFLKSLQPEFGVLLNFGLELLTIMNYNETMIKQLTNDINVLLIQKTRHNYQVVYKK